MIGIGITMEGINQNELLYEFILEKSWRTTLNDSELSQWFKFNLIQIHILVVLIIKFKIFSSLNTIK